MFNSTTIGMGLGTHPSRLLAWGLCEWVDVTTATPLQALRRTFIHDTARRVFIG